jgi:hypothetical protein
MSAAHAVVLQVIKPLKAHQHSNPLAAAAAAAVAAAAVVTAAAAASAARATAVAAAAVMVVVFMCLLCGRRRRPHASLRLCGSASSLLRVLWTAAAGGCIKSAAAYTHMK